MKLDRNVNPDGKGKYALINLRTNQVQWGDGDQFFVIKYKDEFAAPALRAYADAVKAKVADHYGKSLAGTPTPEMNPTQEEIECWRRSHREIAESLSEYAFEIEREAEAAERWPNKRLPD